jgi:hypothetical protein
MGVDDDTTEDYNPHGWIDVATSISHVATSLRSTPSVPLSDYFSVTSAEKGRAMDGRLLYGYSGGDNRLAIPSDGLCSKTIGLEARRDPPRLN